MPGTHSRWLTLIAIWCYARDSPQVTHSHRDMVLCQWTPGVICQHPVVTPLCFLGSTICFCALLGSWFEMGLSVIRILLLKMLQLPQPLTLKIAKIRNLPSVKWKLQSPSSLKCADEAKRSDACRSARSASSTQHSNSLADASDNDCDGDEGDGTNCPSCLIQLVSGGSKVKCDLCLSYYHQKCTEMNTKVFNKFMANVDVTGWVCYDCKYSARTTIHRLDSAIAQLAEELAAIKAQMADMRREDNDVKIVNCLQASLQPPPTTTNDDIIAERTRTTLVVHRTLHDVARRKHNIVISGLPESQPSSDRSIG